MAFTDLNITITEIKITDFVPDFVTVLNSNTSKLKTEIEKIVNSLQIDTTNKKIGATTPVAYIQAIRQEVLANNVANDGYYLTETSGSTTVAIAHLKRAEILPGVFGSELNVDKLVVEQLLDATGASASFKNMTLSETLTVTDVATFNGPVVKNSGDVESVDSALVVPVALSGSDAKGYIDLTKATQRNLLLDVQVALDAYNGGWIITGDIKIALNFDATNPSIHGQCFNIAIKSLKDSTGTVITDALPGSLVIVPGVNKNDGSAAISLSDSKPELELYGSVNVTGAVYLANLELIQLTVGGSYMLHCKNLKIA